MTAKALIMLRRFYNENLKKTLIIAAIIAVVSVTAGVVVDIYLPFEPIPNLIRSFLLIPSGASLFTLAYMGSLKLHYGKNEEWVPYRLRASMSWRRRIAAIVGAFLFVFAYASKDTVGYTFAYSMILVTILALIAYIRPTRKEASLAEFDLKDSRDVIQKNKENDLREKADKRRKSAASFLKGRASAG